jgi:cytochrome oxidase Cu insertion factor (SCO1/SenC/PrrC family)
VPRVVLLTLDPWRDTPSRLPHLAREWKLGSDASVLSGSVEEVNAALDRWGVVRERDPSTGELAHPPLVYVLDASGRIAFAASGGAELLAELVLRG